MVTATITESKLLSGVRALLLSLAFLNSVAFAEITDADRAEIDAIVRSNDAPDEDDSAGVYMLLGLIALGAAYYGIRHIFRGHGSPHRETTRIDMDTFLNMSERERHEFTFSHFPKEERERLWLENQRQADSRGSASGGDRLSAGYDPFA